MNRFFQRSLVATLAAVGLASPHLRAQDADPNVQQMVALYNKIALALQGGKPDDKNLVSLAYPGLQISEGFTQADEVDRNMLYQLFDQIPSVTTVYQPSSQTYSSVYAHILNDQDHTTTKPSDSEEKALQAALALVAPESETFINYQTYERKYLAAQNDRDSAVGNYENAMEDQKLFRRSADEVKNMSDDQRKTYLAEKQALDRAVTDARAAKLQAEADFVNADNAWKSTGKKGAILSAYNTINNVSNMDAGAWWTQLRNRFKLGERGGGQFHNVEFFPSPDTWNKAPVDGKEDPTWVKISFKASEAINTSAAGSTVAGGSLAIRAGKLNIRANAGFAKAMNEAATAENGFEMTFKVKKVAVFRPWMEMLVFKNENWWFNRNYPNDIVAFGNLAKQSDKLLMPLYNHTIILCKDVVMKGKSFSKVASAYQASLTAGGSVSYGPVAIAANYDARDRHTKKVAKVSETGIEAPGVQILGYISSVVDRSPAKTVPK